MLPGFLNIARTKLGRHAVWARKGVRSRFGCIGKMQETVKELADLVIPSKSTVHDEAREEARRRMQAGSMHHVGREVGDTEFESVTSAV